MLGPMKMHNEQDFGLIARAGGMLTSDGNSDCKTHDISMYHLPPWTYPAISWVDDKGTKYTKKPWRVTP